jgi:hypothetical protein
MMWWGIFCAICCRRIQRSFRDLPAVLPPAAAGLQVDKMGELGICHQDINPSNIMVGGAGQQDGAAGRFGAAQGGAVRGGAGHIGGACLPKHGSARLPCAGAGRQAGHTLLWRFPACSTTRLPALCPPNCMPACQPASSLCLQVHLPPSPGRPVLKFGDLKGPSGRS